MNYVFPEVFSVEDASKIELKFEYGYFDESNFILGLCLIPLSIDIQPFQPKI